MLLPASDIALSHPSCPSCYGQIAEGDRACAECGYGFEFAARLLPYDAPSLRKFIDYEGHLSREDIKRAQSGMEKLRKAFPQITLCTCVATVPDELTPSEFGFWLFNQSIPDGPRMEDRRLHSILLCIDTTNEEASLTVGYGIDPFIDDVALESCLTKIKKPLRSGDYGGAIIKLCRVLEKVLERGFDEANARYKASIEAARHQPQTDDAIRPTMTPEPAATPIPQPSNTHV